MELAVHQINVKVNKTDLDFIDHIALVEQKTHQLGRCLEPDTTIVGGGLDGIDGHHRHHVPGHRVPADFVAETCRSLHVHDAAHLELAQIGQTQRLAHQVKAGQLALKRRHGQTATVMGHRGPQLQPRFQPRRQPDLMRAKVSAFFNGHHFRHALYDTREHA